MLADPLRFLAVAEIGQDTIEEALRLPYSDSEDALQMVATMGVGAEYLISETWPATGRVCCTRCSRPGF